MSNGGANDVFSVRVEDAVWEDGTSGAAVTDHVVNRSWHIAEGVAGGNDMDIVVEWATAEEWATFDRAQSGIAHWDGTQWEHPASYTAATATFERWIQTRNHQTTFSPFVVEDILSDLPIELLSFDAQRLNAERVKLNWATATELNNAGFHIERMLDHETAFQTIGFVEGYGNSTTTIRYAYNDPNAYPGISYYRLRQVDFDGTTSYSDIRAVSGMVLDNSDPIVLYPNPTKENVNVRFGALAPQQTSATVRLLDMRGALVQEFEVGIASYQSFSIDAAHLASGAYQVILILNSGEQQVLRFIRE